MREKMYKTKEQQLKEIYADNSNWKIGTFSFNPNNLYDLESVEDAKEFERRFLLTKINEPLISKLHSLNFIMFYHIGKRIKRVGFNKILEVLDLTPKIFDDYIKERNLKKKDPMTSWYFKLDEEFLEW